MKKHGNNRNDRRTGANREYGAAGVGRTGEIRGRLESNLTGAAEKVEILRRAAGNKLHAFGLHVFYSRERILCGAVLAVLMVFFALLQTTVFSVPALRPFGAVPDLMLSFTAALAVTEGRKWGAVYGIVSAVIIDSLGAPGVVLLPLIYMPVGYFCGILCRYYFTGGAAVRAVISFAVLIPRGIVTAALAVIYPLSASAGEIFFDVVIPEAAATLILAAPVHLIVYACMRPFHRTRAEKVS